MYLRTVLRSTPKLDAMSACERPACQCTKISVTSITSKVLLATGSPALTWLADYSTYPFALVGPKGPTRGSFKVYEDGVYQGTVSEYSPTNVGSVVLWTHGSQPAGPHSVKIVVVGTAGHPRVDIDGFLSNQ